MSATDSLLTLQLIGERLAAAPRLDDVIDAVVAGATDHLGATAVNLGLVDDARSEMRPVATVGLQPTSGVLLEEPVELKPGVAAYEVLERGAPLFWATREVRDREFPQYSDYPTAQESWAILPLVARSRAVGVLSLGWESERSFSEEEAALLSAVAHQYAVALDRGLLGEIERAERETLELLGEGTRLMVSELDADVIVSRLVELAVPRLAPWCAVYSVEGDGLRRVALGLAKEGPLADRLREVTVVPLQSERALVRVYKTGRPDFVPDVTIEMVRALYPAELAQEFVEASRTKHWSALSVPVKAGGATIGVLALVSDLWGGVLDSHVLHAAEGLAGRAGIALANAGRFQQEHRTAVVLTQALLPLQYTELPGWEAATRYLPTGGPVAGDWFDVVAVGDDRYLVGVGDTAGHGIEAAATMAELRSAARAFAVAGGEPSDVLGGLDKLLAVTHPDAMATALYGIVGSGSEVVLAAAGHMPALSFGPSGVRYLEWAPTSPLGCVLHEHPNFSFSAEPGDGLLLFTDGVVERRTDDIDERLAALVALVKREIHSSAEELAESVLEELCNEPEDDCCIVVLRRLSSRRRS